MVKIGYFPPQSAIEQQLACGRFQQVSPAHHLRNLHEVIIHYDGELVRGNIISAPNNEISEVPAGHIDLLSEMLVVECNLFRIRHSKPPIHTGRFVEIVCICSLAARTWIERLIVCVIRRTGCSSQILSRTGTRINRALLTQLSPCCQIEFPALALFIGCIRASAIRTFLPRDSQPPHVFEHGQDEFRPAAIRIEVLVAENEGAAKLPRAVCGNEKGSCMPEVQISRRRGRKAPAILP